VGIGVGGGGVRGGLRILIIVKLEFGRLERVGSQSPGFIAGASTELG